MRDLTKEQNDKLLNLSTHCHCHPWSFTILTARAHLCFEIIGCHWTGAQEAPQPTKPVTQIAKERGGQVFFIGRRQYGHTLQLLTGTEILNHVCHHPWGSSVGFRYPRIDDWRMVDTSLVIDTYSAFLGDSIVNLSVIWNAKFIANQHHYSHVETIIELLARSGWRLDRSLGRLLKLKSAAQLLHEAGEAVAEHGKGRQDASLKEELRDLGREIWEPSSPHIHHINPYI